MNTEKLVVQSELLKAARIAPVSRSVLIKTLSHVADEKTPSGILVVGDTDWAPATHADRIGEVVAVPKRLPFEVHADIMPWETQIEISPGMMVLYDFLEGLNCNVFIDENKREYKVLNYDAFYVATLPRYDGEDFGLQESTDGKEYIIPLNGYHLFETVEMEREGKYDISPSRVDPRYGIVKYVAKNNTAYENGISEDHLDLQVGDKVRFGNVPSVMLEDEMHCTFDGGRMYRRSQVRNVEMLWRDGNIILPKGKVLIRQKADEKKTKAGIVLLKSNVKSHAGEVVVSSSEDAPVGSNIKYIKGSGKLIDFKGEKCRVLTEGCILYVE